MLQILFATYTKCQSLKAVMTHMPNENKAMSTLEHIQPVYDFVIVGAGVSGLYAAYKLQQRYPYAQIAILEKMRRYGGRILTDIYGQHVLEYGAMRFEPKLQPNFAALLDELHIPIKSFAPYSSSNSMPDLNSLEFEEIAAIHKYRHVLAPAFALLKYGIQCVLGDQWNVETDDINDPGRDAKKLWLKREGMFQGRYLHKHGLWDTLAHVLSKNALDYMSSKGTFYHMLHLNPNAADQICFMLDILATAKDQLITIEGGTSTLTDRLMKGIPNVSVMFYCQVSKYIENSDGTVNVLFTDGDGEGEEDVVRCMHLIFTCQKKAYKHIDGFPSHIKTMLIDSVMVVKLFKIFVVFDNPPYDENTIPIANHNADKVPCRELHYGFDAIHKTGMVMLYGDCPYLNYWRSFRSAPSESPACDEGVLLKAHLAHYLRQIFPGQLCNILHYSLVDWSQAPYESGVHLWRPGVKSEEVMNTLASFGSENNIHVCGETFSNFQGFIEGSIRSVNNVITHILHT